jgi:hypothetical protein
MHENNLFNALIYSFETFVFLNKDQPILLNSSSDNQSIYRRPLTERRDHENALLFNYDNLNQYTKYGTSSLL